MSTKTSGTVSRNVSGMSARNWLTDINPTDALSVALNLNSEMKKFKVMCSPEVIPHGSWVKQGKVYEATPAGLTEEAFTVTDEDGDRCFCLLKDCAHLNGGNWIIIEEEE